MLQHKCCVNCSKIYCKKVSSSHCSSGPLLLSSAQSDLSEMMVWVFLALQVTPWTGEEVVVADATLTQPEIIIIEIEWFYCTKKHRDLCQKIISFILAQR